MIKNEGGKWILYSHTGKKLYEAESKEQAQKREAQINFFKAFKDGERPRPQVKKKGLTE